MEKFTVGKYTVRIEQDTEPQNPRTEWDNFGHMVCWHRRYDLGDKHQFSDPESFQEFVDDKTNGVAVCLPLYLYDHGGITMSVGPFSCPWDSGQVGYIYATKEDIRKNWNVKRLTKARVEQARKLLIAEVETYDQYLTGDVWCYMIEDEHGEHVDSCCGFFGAKYAEDEARGAAEWRVEQDRIEAARELLKEFELGQFVDRSFAL